MNNNNLRFCFGDLIILLAWLLSCCSSSRSLAIESELTLAIVKPDGISGNYSSSIRNIILQSGFTIQTQATLHLDEHTVTTFYAEHSTKTFFPSLIKYITSGPVLIMVLEKVNAVADWRTLIGPTDARKAKITHPDSIRAMCGEDLERNCVHGSDSRESAAREISFFFPHLLSGTTLKHDEL
ncbi:putative nucleoside-diphosphate kinase [Helianthus debilis subsp. tardiflorus]